MWTFLATDVMGFGGLFIVYAVLPFSFTVMALRFLGRVFGAPEKERELDLSAAHKEEAPKT